MLDLLHTYNSQYSQTRADDSELAARTASYELAFKMQTSVPGWPIFPGRRRRRESCMASMTL
jgi:hypothetical protein